MYKTKEQDHEKRKNQEGSYSLYNHIYHFLLDNFEPEQDINNYFEALFREAKAYCINGGQKISDKEIKYNIQQAIANFKANDGKHGDTADNFGKEHANSINNIKQRLKDLKW